MKPFTELMSQLADTSPEAFASQRVCVAVVGVLRDLRGVVSACSSRRTYTLFFDWVYPNFTPVFQRAAVTYYHLPGAQPPLRFSPSLAK
jgi:exportin-7